MDSRLERVVERLRGDKERYRGAAVQSASAAGERWTTATFSAGSYRSAPRRSRMSSSPRSNIGTTSLVPHWCGCNCLACQGLSGLSDDVRVIIENSGVNRLVDLSP